MPSCKNDTKRYFKGTEPSPKGLGICAHAEKANVRRKGRNGKFWRVKVIRLKSGKRSKRWIPDKKVVAKKRKKVVKKPKPKLKGGMFGLSKQEKLKKKKKTEDIKRAAELQEMVKDDFPLSEDEAKELKTLNKTYKLARYYTPKSATSRKNQTALDNARREFRQQYHTYDPETYYELDASKNSVV